MSPTARHRAGRLVDLLGPAAFPAVFYTTHDFVAATFATAAGATLALAVRWWLDGHLAPLSAVAGTMALLTGALSLVLGSETLLKAEPTVVHLVVGLGFLVAWGLDGRPAKALLGGALALTDRAWATLCLRYGLFAIALGLANEAIRRLEPTSVWALFHFPGQLILHAGFLASQLPLIAAARREAASPSALAKREKAS